MILSLVEYSVHIIKSLKNKEILNCPTELKIPLALSYLHVYLKNRNLLIKARFELKLFIIVFLFFLGK